MSKNKLLIALISAFLASPVLAQSSTPLTIQEWSIMQGNLKRAEYENKLRDERKKGAEGPAPVVVDRSCDEDLQMSAVYGVGRDLRADFIYKGATITLAPGATADMGGWSVKELTGSRALMVRKVKGSKSVKTCSLYRSASTRDYSAPVAPLTGAGDSHVQVPPISPVAVPAAAGAGGSAGSGAAVAGQKPVVVGSAK
jgi:hypothetical protein